MKSIKDFINEARTSANYILNSKEDVIKYLETPYKKQLITPFEETYGQESFFEYKGVLGYFQYDSEIRDGYVSAFFSKEKISNPNNFFKDFNDALVEISKNPKSETSLNNDWTGEKINKSFKCKYADKEKMIDTWTSILTDGNYESYDDAKANSEEVEEEYEDFFEEIKSFTEFFKKYFKIDFNNYTAYKYDCIENS